jgi:D-alanyl-D-alanine carboxypeptidase (penicillin-binding protein 5/6)
VNVRGRWRQHLGENLRRGDRQRLAAGLGLFGCFAVLLLTLGGCGIGGDVAPPAITPVIYAPTPTPTIPAIPQPKLVAPSDAELYLANATTGQVYVAVNADKPMAMASTTKIMTALVALSYGKPDQQITVGADATYAAVNKACGFCGPSAAFLHQGDTIALKDLLYGLLLPSGDDAAMAVADGVAGSPDHFVTLMNLEATLLGLQHTHFTNVHGLDADGHYTTAADLARLTASAMNFATFREIVMQTTYDLGATSSHGHYTWTNTNELLPGESNEYTGAVGVKTGSTGLAGYCLVFEASRSQGQLIGVILGEAQANDRFTDAKKLLDWGFQVEQKQAG